MNKKADVTNIITFLVIIFFLAVSFLVVAFATNELSNIVKMEPFNVTDVSISAGERLDGMVSTTIQRGYIAIFAFLIIGMLVSAFLVRIHPIFIFMYIIFLAITLFIGVPLANTYQLLIENETLSIIGNQQTMINWIMEHLIVILLGVGGLSMLVTFAKLFGQGSGGGFNEQL